MTSEPSIAHGLLYGVRLSFQGDAAKEVKHVSEARGGATLLQPSTKELEAGD